VNTFDVTSWQEVATGPRATNPGSQE